MEIESIDIKGKECVVIGRSNIVGKPMAMLLLQENATLLEEKQDLLNKIENLGTKERTKQREETEEFKTKIDELLRKIDKSLALLISTENHKN